MDFSIVTTLYDSAPYIEEFYNRVCTQVEQISNNFEIIFVNDGSSDNSLIVARSIQESDSRIKIVDLSRNFGHPIAIQVGLEHAIGECVFLIDIDLEEEPELFGKFYKILQESDADVVLGIQKKRKGQFFERISGGIFWHVFNLISNYPIPKNQLVARIMSRRYVDSLLEYREREVFLPGLCALTGFKQIQVPVKKFANGNSTYTFRKKMIDLVNAVTSFSTMPLVFIFYIGMIIVAVSSASALWLIIKKLFFDQFSAGWPSLIVSIWLLGGLTIFCIGLVGIYLSKVFLEAKQRPKAIIRRIYEKKQVTTSDDKSSFSNEQVSREEPIAAAKPVVIFTES